MPSLAGLIVSKSSPSRLMLLRSIELKTISLKNQQSIKLDFDTADAVLAPKNKRQKSKSLFKLKMTGKWLKCLFHPCRSIKFKIFWQLSLHHGGGGGGGGLA